MTPIQTPLPSEISPDGAQFLLKHGLLKVAGEGRPTINDVIEVKERWNVTYRVAVSLFDTNTAIPTSRPMTKPATNNDQSLNN